MGIHRLTTEDIFVCIGKILRPVGLTGTLKVQNLSDLQHRFDGEENLYIGPNSELAVPYKISTLEYRQDSVVIALEGLDSIEKVEFLRGQYCYLPRIDESWLDDDEFFVDDLIGLEVYDNQDQYIGEVKNVMNSLSNDILVVRRNSDEILLPLVDEFIQEINLAKAFIKINPIEGLLEPSHAH